MTLSRRRRIRGISQILTKHEKRMTDAINRRLSLLAREVDARWVTGNPSLVLQSVANFERGLSSIIFRFGIHVAGESGTNVLQHLSIKSSMDIMMEAIRRWLRGYSDQRAQVITNYLRQRIQNELSSGLSDKEIRSKVLDIINNPSSAIRIARTETHTAMERGAFEAARSLGVRLVKEWAANDDQLTRPDHADADGQLREIEEPFTVGGESLQYPGDPTASAKQVVNCRCTALYHLIVDGEIQR